MGLNLKFRIITTLLLPVCCIQRTILQLPEIKSIDETLKKIEREHVSVSRYGDGEFSLIWGKNLGFQQYDPKLGNRMEEILVRPLEGLIVCLPRQMKSLKEYSRDKRAWWIWYLIKNMKKITDYLSKDIIYYDANITRFFRDFKDKSKTEEYFNRFKKLFKGKDLLIIEGEKSRLGVGNDLLDSAASIQRILCPAENAFAQYQEILAAGKKYAKDKLVLIAVGPTATVLAYDLHQAGFWAIDLGHLDIEYEWYLRGNEYDKHVPGKYVNEASQGNIVEECTDVEYLNQIIEKIGTDMERETVE